MFDISKTAFISILINTNNNHIRIEMKMKICHQLFPLKVLILCNNSSMNGIPYFQILIIFTFNII